MALRHFLSLDDLSSTELKQIIRRSIDLKAEHKSGTIFEPLKNRVLALIFENSSTRTRVSFESAMAQFGGSTVFLSPQDSQLSRGETIEDSSRVLSRLVDAVAVRTYEHKNLEAFCDYSNVPVINALSNRFHPCQLLADMQTYQEHRGSIKGKNVLWVGDGNNVCNTFVQASLLLDFHFIIASPTKYAPALATDPKHADHCRLIETPEHAIAEADLVVTDAWCSMGQEDEAAQRAIDFQGYQVNEELLQAAKKDTLFMHCLPAHRGQEVSETLLDSHYSVAWDQAENRLHAQKALLEFLLCNV